MMPLSGGERVSGPKDHIAPVAWESDEPQAASLTTLQVQLLIRARKDAGRAHAPGEPVLARIDATTGELVLSWNGATGPREARA